MKPAWIVFVVFFSSLPLFAAASGLLEVEYEPKQCVMAPCPQYKLESMNGVKAKPFGVVTPNLDLLPVGLKSGEKLVLKGSWENKKGVLEVVVSDWFRLVGEKLPKK